VLQKTASWLVALMLLGGASWASIRAVCADNIVTTAPVSCGPQFMLYVTLPLSSRGSSSLPRYGLRIGEFRKRPTTTQLVAVAPVQRELIDFRIVAHSEFRVEFGRRLVWDVPRGGFGPESSLGTFAIGVPIRASDAVNQQPRQPWDPVPSAMSASAGDPTRTRLVDGERFVIVKVIIPSHWTPTYRRAAYVQLEPTLKFVNTQQTEALILPRSAETR
jgi:hypothetical protein